MTLIDILLTGLISSGVCIGIWTALDEGSVLHFLQRPFIRHREKVEQWKKDQNQDVVEWFKNEISYDNTKRMEDRDDHMKRVNQTKMSRYKEIEMSARITLWYQNIFKPVLLCGRCFASVWGSAVFYGLHGVSMDTIHLLVINVFLTACINVIILNRYYYAE